MVCFDYYYYINMEVSWVIFFAFYAKFHSLCQAANFQLEKILKLQKRAQSINIFWGLHISCLSFFFFSNILTAEIPDTLNIYCYSGVRCT